MQIRFDEIPRQGLFFEVGDQSWFPGHDLQHRGPLLAKVSLQREGDRVTVAGELAATVLLPCDRCLESYPFDLQSTFQVKLELVDPLDQPVVAGAEHLCHLDEMETIELSQPLVDVAELLAQQLYLALPLKRLCREECRGLCPSCGADLNRDPSCACQGGGKDSPFAALRHLKLK
ncbi:YceD family protein [Desulfurivibrio sp. D14AmB]|uniref:YceD family protein n=1 Tax=Desulfurivibrio sp. D14AmB TaxID=3374370 RepID=UPI00376EB7C2